MKKVHLFLFISLFSVVLLHAQKTTFEFMTSGENGLFPYDILEHEDGYIYFTGNLTLKGAPDRKRGFIGKLSPEGYLVDSTTFEMENKTAVFTQIHPSPEGGFMLVGFAHDTTLPIDYNAAFLFAKMDENLALSQITFHALPAHHRIWILNSRLINNQHLYLFGGFPIGEHPSPRAGMYKFDLEFDSIAGKVYDFPGAVTDMKKLPNGNYWTANILSWRYMHLDTAFNHLGFYPTPRFLSAQLNTKWDSDTSFYMLAKTSSHNLCFIKQHHPFDTTSHLFNMWRPSDTLDYPAPVHGIDFNHKDSIFMGGTRNISLNSPLYAYQPSWMVVLQSDSLLNIRWERFYGGDAYYIMHKLIRSPDGGCLVIGKRFDYQNETWQRADIVILKLNKEGLLVGSLPQAQHIAMKEAIAYPNPGHNELRIRVGMQHPFWEFSLYDLNGRLLLQQTGEGTDATFDVSVLGSGTYIYKITNADGLYESGKWVKK